MTNKKFSKLSMNTKIFIAIVIIIGMALALSGASQTAKFIVPGGKCIGTHVACNKLAMRACSDHGGCSPILSTGCFGFNATINCTAYKTNQSCYNVSRYGCQWRANQYAGCNGTAHSCSDLKTATACNAENQFGCNWAFKRL